MEDEKVQRVALDIEDLREFDAHFDRVISEMRALKLRLTWILVILVLPFALGLLLLLLGLVSSVTISTE